MVSELLCTGVQANMERHTQGRKRAKCAHVGDTNNTVMITLISGKPVNPSLVVGGRWAVKIEGEVIKLLLRPSARWHLATATLAAALMILCLSRRGSSAALEVHLSLCIRLYQRMYSG